MTIIFTDGADERFVGLCRELDDYLNFAAGGEKNREQYLQYNTLESIRDAALLLEDGKAVACGSFKRYAPGVAEIKRVFTRQSARGRGCGRAVMNALEERAREQGYEKLILETGRTHLAAVGLYRSLGFEFIENYGQYARMPESVCLEKTLFVRV